MTRTFFAGPDLSPCVTIRHETGVPKVGVATVTLKMKQSILMGALTLPLPAFGQSECLTQADLSNGIAVTLDSGAIEIYRRDPNDGDLVIVEGSGEAGPNYRLVLARGILVQLFETVDETQTAMNVSTRYAYPVLPREVPVPSPQSEWAVAAVRSDSEGDHPEDQVLQSGALIPLAIGGCSYDTFPVTVTYGSDYTEEITYLPELGFGYLHWYQNRGGDKITVNLVSLERAD